MPVPQGNLSKLVSPEPEKSKRHERSATLQLPPPASVRAGLPTCRASLMPLLHTVDAGLLHHWPSTCSIRRGQVCASSQRRCTRSWEASAPSTSVASRPHWSSRVGAPSSPPHPPPPPRPSLQHSFFLAIESQASLSPSPRPLHCTSTQAVWRGDKKLKLKLN